MECLKHTEPNTQTTTSVSAMETAECQDSQSQEPSAAPKTLRPAHPTGIKVLQAPTVIPTERDILCLIASNYLTTEPLKSRDDRDAFLTYMKEMRQVLQLSGTGVVAWNQAS